MLILALSLAFGPVPEAVLDRGDAATERFVACLFAVSRQARSENLPADAFDRRLAGSCVSEERALNAASTAIFTAQGQASAVDKARQMTAETRRGIREQYRALPEVERQLEQLGALCRANPAECR
jgi:hypothetical protein